MVSDSQENSIAEYEAVLAATRREENSLGWAALHLSLGKVFEMRSAGDPEENLDRAIWEYELALEVFSRRTEPKSWASTLANLGICLLSRRGGDPGEDLDRAIAAFQESRRVITRRLDPEQWADLTVNLGVAYLSRWHGDPAENIERGIQYLRQALAVFTRSQFPYDWATTLSSLGTAWANRIRGRREMNLERALGYFNQALRALDPRTSPYDRAGVLVNLGATYRARGRGDRSDNLERALRAYREAMRLRPREVDPERWASLRLNLSLVYQQRIRGRQADNKERALTLASEALEILTEGGDSIGRSRALLGISEILQDRIRGDREENFEQAIAAAKEALEIASREGEPALREGAMDALGTAFLARPRGDRSENLETAIDLFERLLEIRTRENRGHQWARTMVHLAIAYRDLTRGDRTENLERSIDILNQALEEQERGAPAADRAVTLIHLTSAYQERLQGDQGENLERSIQLGLRAVALMRRGNVAERGLALMLVGISLTLRIHGDPAENVEAAIQAYRTALRVLRRAPARERVRVLTNLGTAWLQRQRGDRSENLEAALRDTRRALRLQRREDAPVEWAATLHNLGRIYSERLRGRRSENVRKALAAFRSALEVRSFESLPHDCRMTASQMGDLLADEDRWDEADAAYRLALQAAEALYRSSLAPQSRDLELGETGDLAWRGAFAQMRAGRLEEAVATAELARARGLGEALMRARADLPGFEAFLHESGFEEIVADVPSGSALAYLVVTRCGGMALCLVADPQNPSIQVFSLWLESLTSEALDHLLGMPDGRQVKEGYLQGQLVSTDGLELALGDVLARLGRDLIGPLADRLRGRGVESVILIPGGKLSLLPLHAAPYWVEGRRLCLLDEMDAAYAPAARVLASARAALGRETSPSLGGLAEPRPDPRPLQYARTELSRIADLFLPGTRQIAVCEEATREAFFRMYGQVTHLHLACHGGFEGWDVLGSYLLLAQGEKLELRDLMALRVPRPPRLVVLSACQTAVHEFQNTPDEVIGLPAGFMRSGVPGVVACLWNVDDLSTALLMARFYEFHLHGVLRSRCRQPVRCAWHSFGCGTSKPASCSNSSASNESWRGEVARLWNQISSPTGRFSFFWRSRRAAPIPPTITGRRSFSLGFERCRLVSLQSLDEHRPEVVRCFALGQGLVRGGVKYTQARSEQERGARSFNVQGGVVGATKPMIPFRVGDISKMTAVYPDTTGIFFFTISVDSSSEKVLIYSAERYINVGVLLFELG